LPVKATYANAKLAELAKNTSLELYFESNPRHPWSYRKDGKRQYCKSCDLRSDRKPSSACSSLAHYRNYERFKERQRIRWHATFVKGSEFFEKERLRSRYKKYRTYNISPQEVLHALEEQNYKCAICKEPMSFESALVDHDHSTMEVRGLLCRKCNSALGFFRDNELIIKSAFEYLLKNKKNDDDSSLEVVTIQICHL
jgi:hypothetical protein